MSNLGSFSIGGPDVSAPRGNNGHGSGGGCGGGCGGAAVAPTASQVSGFQITSNPNGNGQCDSHKHTPPDRGVLSNFKRLLLKHGKYLVRYPHITRRVIENYFKLLVLKRPVLRQVEFCVTYWCNAYCDHCSATSMHRSAPSNMELGLIRRVMQECIDLGALSINITGGEALHHPEICDIVRAAQPKKVVVSVATNGLLMTQKMTRDLGQAGVQIVSLALDSARPEVHDERKKIPGGFDAAMKAIQNCHDNGIEVFLCTILTPFNMSDGDAWEMVELAEKLGCTLTVNIANAVGSWTGNNEILLDDTHIKTFHEMVALPNVRWDGGSNYLRSGCPAGIEKIYLSSYGEVTPCPRIHLSYGSVKQEPLRDIWERMIRPKGEWHSVYRGGCPVGDDAEFRQRVMDPIDDAAGFLHVKEHPNLAGPAS